MPFIMKKFAFFASLFLLAACGSTTTISTTSPTSPSPSVSQNTGQPNQPVNFTPPIPKSVMDGIGPVNIAESNFYFAGDFQVADGMPLFYDCMAGANIPIATDKGVYQELLTRYNNMASTSGEVLRARIHGYFVNEPTVDYPKKLVVTYVNSLTKGTICDRQKQLPGVWTADLIGTEKGTVVLKLTNTFDFTYDITTASGTNTIRGSWMMTSGGEIGLFYLDITKLLGHSIAFNPNNMTLFMPTQTGTLIFKKN